MQKIDSNFSSDDSQKPDNDSDKGFDWNRVFSNASSSSDCENRADDMIDFSPSTEDSTRDRLISALFGDDDERKVESRKEAPPEKRIEARPAPIDKPIPLDRPIDDKLNPKFKELSTEQLSQALDKGLQSLATIKDKTSPEFTKLGADCIETFRELIARSDSMLDNKSFNDASQALPLLQDALKQGKEITSDKEGKRIVGDTPLSSEARWNYHLAVFGDLQTMGDQIAHRDRFAILLKFLGKDQDADKMTKECEDLKSRLAKPIEVNGKQVSILNVIKQEAKQLAEDTSIFKSQENKSKEMERGSIYLGELAEFIEAKKEKQPAKDAGKPAEADKQARDPNVTEIMAKLNPKFKEKSNEEIEKQLSTDMSVLVKLKDFPGVDSSKLMAECKEAFDELRNRADVTLDAKGFDDSMRTIPILLDALKNGKDIKEGPDGKRALSDEPLSASRRWQFHLAVFGDMEAIHRQIEVRENYAIFLRSVDQNKDAESMLLEARELAERLVKPIEVDGKKIMPVNLIKSEGQQLRDDLNKFSDPEKRKALQEGSIFLLGSDANSGTMKTPINLNKHLAEFYLAPRCIVEPSEPGQPLRIKEIQFGTSNAFKPQKSYEAAIRAREHIETVFGPKAGPQAVDDNIGVLFAGIAEVLNNPKQFDLYKVDEKGAPLFISELEADKLREKVRETSGSYSFLIDAGIFALGTGALVLSRNPKLAAMFEKAAAKIGAPSVGKTVLKAGAAAVAVTGATLARNVAFEKLGGVQESLVESAEHAVGSLALSVVAMRTAKASSAFQPFKNPGVDSAIRRAAGATIVSGSVLSGVNPSEVRRSNQLQDLLKKTQEPIENKK